MIPDQQTDSFIVTGGVDSGVTVSRYGLEGFREMLPSLQQDRHSHACGGYTDRKNNWVRGRLKWLKKREKRSLYRILFTD